MTPETPSPPRRPFPGAHPPVGVDLASAEAKNDAGYLPSRPSQKTAPVARQNEASGEVPFYRKEIAP
jgi:hypothetical protein